MPPHTNPAFSAPCLTSTFFSSALPISHHPPRHAAPLRRRRTVLPVYMTSTPPPDKDDNDKDLTVGDAFREWIIARDRGETPQGNPLEQSCGPNKVNVLFVGRDNSTTSVAAEAIFTDLCKRRKLDCFTSHSAGTRVGKEGEGKGPDRRFVEALKFKRGLDVSRKMACGLEKADLESYCLIVCMDEGTRSDVLYMVADGEGKHGEEEEKRIVVLSAYCSEPRLKGVQFREGGYGGGAVNFLVAALVDACHGLLVRLIEEPNIAKG